MDVVLAHDSQKQYKRLRKAEQQKIKKRSMALSEQPNAGKKLEGKLAGLQVIRAWPYRIVYYIGDEKKIIYITAILRRQGAYKLK